MIVPMQKIYLVARQADRDRLLGILRDSGIVHLVPVHPELAVPDEATSRQVDAIRSALRELSGVEPRGSKPEASPSEAAREVLDIERRAAEGRNHLTTLYHQLEQIAVWDDLRLEQVEELRQAGLDVRFYSMSADVAAQVKAECVAEVADLPGQKVMVAVADRSGQIEVPDGAEPMRLPPRDAATIRAEAKQVDEAVHRDMERLHQLAHLVPAMESERVRLEQQVEETVAVRGAVADENLFAVQGWLPEENYAALDEQLAEQGIPVVLEKLGPAEDEQPPTLVRPPAWARPIEGLFKMLGTVPGYREFDVSVPFLIALPIFTAMLISDGGYGAVLLLGPALAYPWAARNFGARFTQLLMVVGAVSVVWGVLTNAFFGFALLPVTLIPIELTDESRVFMMRLSFIIGAFHLSLAQLWQGVRYFPDLRWLNRLGWALFVWGMYGVVNMFVLQGPMTWQTPWPYLLIAGAVLAIGFASPGPNLAKVLGMGLAQFPLSMLSAFSDVISYVRLMAVGLASSVLAVSFNDMALQSGILPITILVLVLGHGLNIGLALIAMFAHGVRLNMLEFGSNLGMEWAGYPYRPFAHRSE
jgi:V/A-type H+-transporting ATPase subunit I